MKRLLILCTVLFYCSISSNAQEGCVSTATGYLYTNLISAYGNIYDKTPVIQNTNSVFCMESTASSCFIRSSSPCQGCYQIGSYYYQQGSEFSFSYVPCPIDDYCLLLIIPIGLFTYLKIRNLNKKPSFE